MLVAIVNGDFPNTLVPSEKKHLKTPYWKSSCSRFTVIKYSVSLVSLWEEILQKKKLPYYHHACLVWSSLSLYFISHYFLKNELITLCFTDLHFYRTFWFWKTIFFWKFDGKLSFQGWCLIGLQTSKNFVQFWNSVLIFIFLLNSLKT